MQQNKFNGYDFYLSKCQNFKDDCTNFCGLLRKAELYMKKSSRTTKIVFSVYIGPKVSSRLKILDKNEH